MRSALEAYVQEREARLASLRAAADIQKTESSRLKANVQQQVGPPATPQRQSTPSSKSVSGSKSDNIYAHLNMEARKRFQAEVDSAQDKYGKLMREALTKPEPQRSEEMAKWKNCYNTKLSVTRKKFGIRLKERRTQEEMDTERRRLLGDDGPELWSELERAAKRPRTDVGPASSPVPPSSSAPQPSQSLTPRKRVALAEMGGLSGSAGSAEMTDPTALLTTTAPRGLTHLQQVQAQAQAQAQTSGTPWPGVGATRDDPVTVGEGSSSDGSAASHDPIDEEMSTDSGDGEDIPSRTG